MFLVIFFTSLCIGSFLNVLATRVLHGRKFWTMRSYCPSCQNVIAWYDNIPLISFVLLRGKCRSCRAPISWLYPFTELVTAVLLTALFCSDSVSPAAYAFFFCALIAATRTDFEAMLIPQLFSIWLAPVGFVAAYTDFLDISLFESLLGAFLGYGILWLLAFVFKRYAHKEGMGIGDMELLALIGSFLGPVGVWISLMIASLSGLVLGSMYVLGTGKREGTRIPFGPFLGFGAVAYFFFRNILLDFLFSL